MTAIKAEMTYSALVVDDNFYNRDIFKIALEMAGYDVTEADNGSDGLDLLTRGGYDLLILDLHMPKMDGRAVLKNVRQLALDHGLRVVVVTANSQMATDEVTSMADFVMYKPIDVREFKDFVTRLKRQ
jgi:CheY-like chemotaxis protein